jgi:tRNA threonylcarbamoyl adenosine modification protein YjeE
VIDDRLELFGIFSVSTALEWVSHNESHLPIMTSVVYIHSEAHMLRLGALMANQLRSSKLLPFFVTLSGPVGAGKSVIARALLQRYYRDDKLRVPSPTYTIMQSYGSGKRVVHHVDLYRLEDRIDDLKRLGLAPLWERGESFIVEWPSLLIALHPHWCRLDVNIALEEGEDEKRKITLSASWSEGNELLKRLDTALRSSV